MKYFIYCRKSQEAEDRQVMSLEGQIKEITKKFSENPEMEIVGVFHESKSAKQPGRVKFNEMIERIRQGEAQGIIAWHPDRLARNSIDGGQVIFLLDQGHLVDMKFCTYSFENTPQGKFMLGIMFSNSKYYSDSLSVNVKRGMQLKVERGWKPGLAPIGYRNCRETGTVVQQAKHAKIVRKMFDLLLSGYHTPTSIHRVLCEQWNYKTPIRKKYGGKPLTLSAVYKLLSNPFYTGDFRWNGQLYAGKHQPIITKDEFLRAQKMLGNDQFTPPKRNHFTYARLFHCGVCGLSVTPDKKTKPSGRTYIYYRCTRKHVTPKCTEPSIEEKVLEEQVTEFIERVTIPQPFFEWLCEQLQNTDNQLQQTQAEEVRDNRQVLSDYKQQLATLTDLRVRNLITDADYLDKREKLQIECSAAEERLQKSQEAKCTLEPIKILTLFLFQAKNCFLCASPEDKRKLLQILSSNPTLKSRKALLEAKKPFEEIVDLDNFVRRCGCEQNIRTADSCKCTIPKRRINKLARTCRLPETQQLVADIKHYLKNHSQSELLDLVKIPRL